MEEALDIMRQQGPILRTSVPTAWMRLRLLCMDLEVRQGLPINQRAISDLEAFLIDRQIDQRLGELRRLCALAELSRP
jgi:hypothetical protein